MLIRKYIGTRPISQNTKKKNRSSETNSPIRLRMSIFIKPKFMLRHSLKVQRYLLFPLVSLAAGPTAAQSINPDQNGSEHHLRNSGCKDQIGANDDQH